MSSLSYILEEIPCTGIPCTGNRSAPMFPVPGIAQRLCSLYRESLSAHCSFVFFWSMLFWVFTWLGAAAASFRVFTMYTVFWADGSGSRFILSFYCIRHRENFGKGTLTPPPLVFSKSWMKGGGKCTFPKISPVSDTVKTLNEAAAAPSRD